METKHVIYLGIFIGGTVGGLLGMVLDHGNGLGFWSLLLGGLVGPLLGIWAGYKLGNL